MAENSSLNHLVNYISMRILPLLCLFLFVLIPAAGMGAVVLDVSVSGGSQERHDKAASQVGVSVDPRLAGRIIMDEEMSAALLSRLRIYQQRESLRLSVSEMRRLHRGAPAEIRSMLEPLGYYSPEIESALVEREGVWQASYVVTPGEPVRVHTVTLTASGPGSLLSLFSDLGRHFPLQEGAVLNHQQYESGKKQILQWARANGFIEARFEKSEIRVHRENRQADIELLLNTGHRFLFGKTHSDQEIISQELLARYLPYKEGDPYSLRALTRLQSILYETGFFSGVVVEPEFDKLSEQRVPVALTLAPALRNRYSLGLGYGTDTGIRGKMEWKNRLLNNSGHKAQSFLQLSEKISMFGATYEIPVADPRYDALQYAGSWASEQWDNTQTNLLSVAAALSHTGPVYQYGAAFEIRDEKYDVGVTSGSSFLLLPRVGWSVVFAEDRINTEDGWRFFVDVKGTDKSLLSDATFVQAQAGVKGIKSLFDKWRLIGRFTLGGTAVDSIDDLPPSLRFYAGGDQSVRGYDYKGLGPVDASGTVVGGRYLMVGSMEIERKVNELWSAAVFYDTGQAMDSMNVDLKQSVGFGGRIALPFGRIRMDLAFPLAEEEFSYRFHLNVGADL
jgi:translocation and assembly module TamA